MEDSTKCVARSLEVISKIVTCWSWLGCLVVDIPVPALKAGKRVVTPTVAWLGSFVHRWTIGHSTGDVELTP